MRKTNRTISSLDSKTNDKIPPFNKIGSFAIKSAPIIIVIKKGVAYFKYMLAIISAPQMISIIATRKRVVCGSGRPKLKKTSIKSETNNFTIPDAMNTYPMT